MIYGCPQDASLDFSTDQFTAKSLSYALQKLQGSGEVFTARIGSKDYPAILFKVEVAVNDYRGTSFRVDLKILTDVVVNHRNILIDFTPFVKIRPEFPDVMRSLQAFGGPPLDRYTAIAAKGLGKWAHNISKEERQLAKTEWLRVCYQASPQDTVATLEQRCIDNIKAGQ